MPTVLSVQSRVAYGHVGNAAAVFALQRLGVEAWAIDTVAFSNHTGHGRWRGRIVPAGEVAALFDGIADLGVPARCDAVLSGYLGEAATGPVLLDIVDRVRAARPRALFCCDPVIGDTNTGMYVKPGIAEFFRDRAIARADIVTPNRFELEWLSGQTIGTLAEAVAAAMALRRRGPDTVLVTSLEPDPAHVAIAAVGGEGAWVATTPRLPVTLNGCGDVTAALFLAWRLKGRSLPEALGATMAAIHEIIAATHRAGADELVLVAAQDALAAPPATIAVERL